MSYNLLALHNNTDATNLDLKSVLINSHAVEVLFFIFLFTFCNLSYCRL